jgi:carbon monoxide dehydrogenase subunit G
MASACDFSWNREIAAPSGYTITGEGKGGIAGFAKGWCKVHLVESNTHTTELHYAAKSEVGGNSPALAPASQPSICMQQSSRLFFNNVTVSSA